MSPLTQGMIWCVRHVYGPAGGPVAVLLPGTASTSDFVARAFGPALAALGIGLVSTDPPRAGDPAAQLAALDAAAQRLRPVLVGGISLGAHLAVRWAAAAGGGPAGAPAGLLLAMPAWTGPPGTVAGASAAAAAEVERDGIRAALAAIRRRSAQSPAAGWITEELSTAWPSYRHDELVSALRSTAGARGPTPAELSAVSLPTGVVALTDDPLHPASVAREWAACLPRSGLVETHLAAVGADRGALGRGAVLGWLRARFGAPADGRPGVSPR